jgi:flagellar FliL protein
MASSTITPVQADRPAVRARSGRARTLLVIAVAALLTAGATYYLVVLRPEATAAATLTTTQSRPEEGSVVSLDPIYVNLAGGHFLKLGLALQATTSAPKELDGAKALDAAISVFSGQVMADVATPATREELKNKLVTQVEALYFDEVMDVYFTEFVMQ